MEGLDEFRGTGSFKELVQTHTNYVFGSSSNG